MSIKFHRNLPCNQKAFGYKRIGNKSFIWLGPLFIEVRND